MNCIHPLHSDICPPARFTYPFAYEPHPLCQLAAREVQSYIESQDAIRQDADNGKMFGVLVVTLPSTGPHTTGTDGGFAYLAAYSGLLAGRNDWPFFVPPVFDAQQPDGYFKQQERAISLMVHGPSSTPHHPTPNTKELSQQLQMWLFHQYQLLNARGETKDLVDIWQEYYSRPKLRQKFPLPPGGTGDCCAPKLLQYAYQHGMHPVCMAEFWWGAPTKTELRQHLNYYPACRGKCKPIPTWMLQGLDVDPDPETLGFARLELPVIYEDQWLLVVNKPSGLLSVPGRIETYSVEQIMQERYPGSLIGHRLDMGTSGLLIVCKSIDVFRPLQQQFVRHEVRKKYIAQLEPADTCRFPQTADGSRRPDTAREGTISLPLRPDPMNRPRQVVDMEHGKRAVTNYQFIDDNTVALYPQTGRTHQLRIHCAHPDGLGRPIVGDELYGTHSAGQRLMLHAAELWFRHPVTGMDMHLEVPFQ